jgi:glutamate carboxypeptidase
MTAPDTNALVESVRTLVVVESPTADIDSCAMAVSAAHGICGHWITAPARIEEHEGRPVLRWGPQEPEVLLLGHLDTVWPLGTLERLPWACDGSSLTGPGVFDMKAGVVQAIAAIGMLGLDPDDGVGLLLTTDEETGSHRSRAIISRAIASARAVLVFEPSLDGALKTSRKGTSWYQAELTGRAAHAGLDPERGINALLAAAGLATATLGWADPAAGTTVTPTMLTAGTTANTVPAHASLTIDVRAWTAAEQQRVDASVRRWAPLEGSIAFDGGIDRPAMESSSSERLFKLAGECAAGLGLPPLAQASVGGASDGNLTAAAGVATLDGLGAVGDGAHADHEWASVKDLAPRTALAAALIQRLLDERLDDK